MQRSLGVLKLCCKFQVNIKKEKKRGKEREEGGGKEGRKEGRKGETTLGLCFLWSDLSLSFFFHLVLMLWIIAINQKSVSFIHIPIPFG